MFVDLGCAEPHTCVFTYGGDPGHVSSARRYCLGLTGFLSPWRGETRLPTHPSSSPPSCCLPFLCPPPPLPLPPFRCSAFCRVAASLACAVCSRGVRVCKSSLSRLRCPLVWDLSSTIKRWSTIILWDTRAALGGSGVQGCRGKSAGRKNTYTYFFPTNKFTARPLRARTPERCPVVP